MVLPELKEALGLLRRIPVLWVPGLVTGLLAAVIWLAFTAEGSFFASRLVLIWLLIAGFFLAGSYAVIRNGNGGIRELITGSITYLFRVLLPMLVITFCTLILVTLVMIALSSGGGGANPGVMGVVSICILVPVAFLTFFSDTAAVFEDRRIFDAIRRSIHLVTGHPVRVLRFFAVSAAVFFGITFLLMVVWEAVLYDKLEPLTRFNETQIAAFTPDQLAGMIGTDGTLITAVCLFAGFLVLMPILSVYKACFFRSSSQGSVSVDQPVAGEYDSKGRWYRY
jgi:hypothetical protein